MKTRTIKKTLRRGFTLLEVLLVLAILSVIAALVVPQLIGTLSGSNNDAAKISIKTIENQLNRYSIDHHDTFPEGSGEEVLFEYLTQGEQLDNGRDIPPYLDMDALKDPWGQYFFYEYPTDKTPNGLKPAIWSIGKDGQSGTKDDITNWLVETN